MIVLSRLNGEQFALNCDLIETMQTNHDTVIRLSNGNSYIVSETVDEIIEKIKEYRKSVFSVIVNSAFEK
ncbi:MAG: flagellar FlbD family protein [Oscillospiraceae bacterium]